MITQILRAVFIAVAIYLFTRIGKQFIDKMLNKDHDQNPSSSSSTDQRSALTPCPKCGVYYDSENAQACSKCNAPNDNSN